MTIEFKAFPKIPRLASPFTITEKIDGTNSTVVIDAQSYDLYEIADDRCVAMVPGIHVGRDDVDYHVYAQSRNRFITPGSDNFGFAAWVKGNAEILVEKLGPGYHAGEWWGHGIQRGYGLPKGERRFSLFNVGRFRDPRTGCRFDLERHVDPCVPEIGLGVVPILWEGFVDFDLYEISNMVDRQIANLAHYGSYAADGFDRPEGLILYHGRSGQLFKSFVDDAEKAREVAARGGLVLAA